MIQSYETTYKTTVLDSRVFIGDIRTIVLGIILLLVAIALVVLRMGLSFAPAWCNARHGIRRAKGNPLYLEELVKMLVEDGIIIKGEAYWSVHPEKLGSINVPPTLAGVLQARLGGLPQEEKYVLQQASVVRRQLGDCVVA